MERNVMETLESIPDYRKGNAIKHKLAEVLMIALLTIISNGNDFVSMRSFGKRHEETLRYFMELPHGIPSEDTFERIFAHLNPKVVSMVFLEWVEEIKQSATQCENARLLVGIDGKTIRRSKGVGKKAVHVVTAFASELGLVLGELATDVKSNEITAIPKLLDMFCQKGMVITIDAIGTQTDIVETIIDKEADYVISVKGNQETLHNDIALLVEHELLEADKDELVENGHYERTIEKGHGRIETRECYISPETGWLSDPEKWVGLKGFGVIISKREETGKSPTYNRDYFIYSLENTSAAELLHIKRSHWAIENKLHWVLDVVFREDDSRARTDNAPENLNIFRKEALQLFKQETSEKGSLKNKRYIASLDLSYALKVIGVK